MPHKRPRDGQQRARLAEGKLHGADDEPDGRVAQQRAERAARLHRAAEAQEETRADGARDANHGEVALAEAALEAAPLRRRHEVRVEAAVVAAVVTAAGNAAVQDAPAVVGVRREQRSGVVRHDFRRLGRGRGRRLLVGERFARHGLSVRSEGRGRGG